MRAGLCHARYHCCSCERLLRFVIQENDFFNLTQAKIAEAVNKAAAKGPFIARITRIAFGDDGDSRGRHEGSGPGPAAS